MHKIKTIIDVWFVHEGDLSVIYFNKNTSMHSTLSQIHFPPLLNIK